MELNSPHGTYIILLMNTIVLLVLPHRMNFAEKQKLNYSKAPQKHNYHNFLDVTLFHHLFLF